MKKLALLLVCVLCPFMLYAQENWKAFLRYDKQKAKADLTEYLQKYAKIN